MVKRVVVGEDSVKKTSRLSKAASLDLDLVRGLAAILVALSHWRYLFLQDFETLQRPTQFAKCFYFLTGLGHQAVMVFFVLSGFLVGGSVVRAVRAERWSWTQYALDRSSRLYIVLLPALLLGTVWDELGILMSGTHGVYGGVPEFKALFAYPVQNSLTPAAFLGSLFFLQTIVTRTFGSNGPLWSLANEFWYYVAFPCLWLTAFGRIRPGLRVLAGALAILILIGVGRDIAALFSVWLLGVLLAVKPLPTVFRGPWMRWGSFGVWLVTLSLHRFHHLGNPVLSDLVLGATTCAWLATIIASEDQPRRALRSRISRSLSGVSYSLYLFHLPILVWIASLCVGSRRWSYSGINVSLAVLCLCPIALYVSAAWWLFERNTSRLRSWIDTQFQTTSKHPSGAIQVSSLRSTDPEREIAHEKIPS